MTPARNLLTTSTFALLFALTACTSDDPATGADASPTPDGTATSPQDAPPSDDLVQATRLADVAADTALTPGRYAMEFSSDESGAPMVLVDVPAGYEAGGDGYEFAAWPDRGNLRHFGTWTVAELVAQPCGDIAWVDPGPSVDDLADALAALPVWESTPPVPTTIGGHEGVFMELNVPADLPARCNGDLLSWRDHLGSTQGIGPGKTQRLWILDVDGHRLMLIAGYFPGPKGPTPGQVDKMTQMAEGATFVGADQVAP